MKVSAEIRWFWDISDLSPLKKWFLDSANHEGIECGGGDLRWDRYFALGQDEIGLKARDINSGPETIEVKGLVAEKPVVETPAPVQVWCKWQLPGLRLPATVASIDVAKRRWVRKFNITSSVPSEVRTGADEMPLEEKKPLPSGCTVEYAEIAVGRGGWTTFGLEASGPLESVETSVRATFATMMARGLLLPEGSLILSYPSWLSHVCTRKLAE